MRDDDHHAEQQRDGVEVDGAVGLLEAQHAARHHQARAEQRRAGAVEPEPRYAAQGDDDISGGKDQRGDHGRDSGGGRASLPAVPCVNNR